jgi:hypothetical protein
MWTSHYLENTKRVYSCMRFLPALLLCFILISCGDDKPEVSDKPPILATTLRLPEIPGGMSVDTTFPSLRISAWQSIEWGDSVGVDIDSLDIFVEYFEGTNKQAVNIYADSSIEAYKIDSIVQVRCDGWDIRLIGINNGQELAVPFHTLHRFPKESDNHYALEGEYFNLHINRDYKTVNDWPYKYTSLDNFFGPFYSDAFSPFDSSSKYPSRAMQTVNALVMQGSAWDGVNFREGADSAQKLAAYNEFVNKLEIFDKAGPFWTMRVAMIDLTYDDSVTWYQFMNVVASHYHWLSVKRNGAKQYLSDYIANQGTDPSNEFTDEDLHLLYPDRLRWNGFISGKAESRYDPDMLSNW